MEIVIEKGCGLDVHKETVVACIMGTGIKMEIRGAIRRSSQKTLCGLHKSAMGK